MHAFVARLPQNSQSGSALSDAANTRAGATATSSAVEEGGVAARAAAAAGEEGVVEGEEAARRSEVEGVEERTCSVGGLRADPAFFPTLFIRRSVVECVGLYLNVGAFVALHLPRQPRVVTLSVVCRQ